MYLTLLLAILALATLLLAAGVDKLQSGFSGPLLFGVPSWLAGQSERPTAIFRDHHSREGQIGSDSVSGFTLGEKAEADRRYSPEEQVPEECQIR
jgi:hypothetical protein